MLLYSQRFAAPSAALSHLCQRMRHRHFRFGQQSKDVGRGNPTGDRDQQNVSVDVGPKEASVPGSAMSSWLKPLDARRKNACVPQGGEPTSWEQKPAMLVPGKSLRSPFQDRSHAAGASAPSSPKQAKEETRAESGQQKKV
ncbi:hypothetical protein V8C43DRAFT_277089, partial [Trichoderma afarasin]